MNLKIIGITLIAIGILMMAYTGFNIVTSEKVIDAGPIKINHEENHPVQWSPIIGGVLLAGGVVILLMGKKVRTT